MLSSGLYTEYISVGLYDKFVHDALGNEKYVLNCFCEWKSTLSAVLVRAYAQELML